MFLGYVYPRKQLKYNLWERSRNHYSQGILPSHEIKIESDVTVTMELFDF